MVKGTVDRRAGIVFSSYGRVPKRPEGLGVKRQVKQITFSYPTTLWGPQKEHNSAGMSLCESSLLLLLSKTFLGLLIFRDLILSFHSLTQSTNIEFPLCTDH